MDLQAVEAKVNAFVTNVLPEKYNDKLESISTSYKVNKALIIIFIALLPILAVVLLGFGNFVIDLIGFVYPLYCSIKAIQSDDKDDDLQWLTYWLIFGSFKLFESITDFFISFIPFYFVIKVAFLVWCYYPTTLGAAKIYHVFFKSYIIPYIPIDEVTMDINKPIGVSQAINDVRDHVIGGGSGSSGESSPTNPINNIAVNSNDGTSTNSTAAANSAKKTN